jgi:hypothetical protein
MGACAADPGDALKVAEDGGIAGSDAEPQVGEDSSSSVDAESLPDATTPPDDTSPSEMDEMETGTSPEDTGPVDAPAPPPQADGSGCEAGSLVITATDPSTGNGPGTVGDFGTTGAVCVKVLGGIVSQYGGWNSSNVTGRTVTLNGMSVPVGGSQGAVAPGPDGYATWQWTAGADSYASMALF